MTRHFLQLYLLIVLTLAATSWTQEQLWRLYGRQSAAEMTAAHPVQAGVLRLLEGELLAAAPDERDARLRLLAARAQLQLELLGREDIAGEATLERLAAGELAFMDAADGESWIMKALQGDGRVLALRYRNDAAARAPLEWVFAFVFYAAIALGLMIWLWPLSRDLRTLERATARFGDRNWRFDANLSPRSQIFPLAQAFRRMAARIDGLIQSHKDMTNSAAHEIKTPLARMRFEIEMARSTRDPAQAAARLDNLDADVTELNAFVTAMLDYAILERAEVSLNLGEHDFTAMIPAVIESAQRSARQGIRVCSDVAADATCVQCDAHLLETVLRNLLYNAMRYARAEIKVTFAVDERATYRLTVEDDGPGVPEPDRKRVFDPFVRLAAASGEQSGFGLGLAIVKRVLDWHGGAVGVTDSPLGGARFWAQWQGRSTGP